MEKETEKDKVENLKLRFEDLKTERNKFLPNWKDVQKYVSPSVYNWDDPKDKAPKKTSRYTTRPTQFAKTLRSGLVGYSISPNIVWFKLSLENKTDLDKIYGAKDWLEEVERILYTEFSRSNLYKQVSMMISSAIYFGHGVMLIDEIIGENKLRFTALKPQEVYLDVDEYDVPDTVFRRYTMKLRNAVNFFGKDKLSDQQRERLKNNEGLNDDITIIHAVYKREDYDSESKGSNNMPYASVYIDESEDKILKEGGYHEFPYAVFIWDQIIGTPYGESPSIEALDDIKNLNRIDEQKLKMCQQAGSPAYNVHDSNRGQENVVPGGYNYFVHPEEKTSVIDSGTNFPISLEIYRDIEDRVKDCFCVDFFMALQQKQGKMTATEVMELQGEKASVLSDLVVSEDSTIEKVIQRSFNINWRQGKIPQPPVDLATSGAELKINFMGPLAQAQKKYHESAGIQQSLNIIGAVAKIAGQTALDVVDFDKTLTRGLEGAGFPQDAIREQKDIEALRAQRAQMQQQQQQQAAAMETQKQMLGNYGKLNEPVKPGSAIDELNKQMAGGLDYELLER